MAEALLSQLLAEATRRLREAGIEAPQREARLLMALAANMSTAELIAKDQEPVPGELAAMFGAMVNKREARIPFQHIAGYTQFYGHKFICDDRALVPRPDSEAVIDVALEVMPRGRGVRIADLGTGSGCLLISLLLERGGVTGVGVDADGGAASLAVQNVRYHKLEERAEILVMPWARWRGWGEVDLIVSNPPYIETCVLSTLEDEVRLHDPAKALDGGADGLDAYREIIDLASAGMRPGSWLVLEIGYDQNAAVAQLLGAAGFTAIGGRKDLSGNDRVVFGQQA